jgi:hypothetical protein
MAPIRFSIELLNTGERLPVLLQDTTTLWSLKELLVDSGREIDDETLKLIHHGRILPIHDASGRERSLRDAGIRHGSRLKAMWSRNRDMIKIPSARQVSGASNRDDWVAFSGQERVSTGEPGQEAVGRQSKSIDPGISSHPIPQTPPGKKKEDSSASFKKGDAVLYRSRDGKWSKVTIASVDYSLFPPSYGINIVAPDGSTSYRETEASRLKPIPETDTSPT